LTGTSCQSFFPSVSFSETISTADPSEHAVLIVSEKLTEVKKDWQEVPVNHFVAVDENLSVSISPISA